LRTGWSVLIAVVLYRLFSRGLGVIAVGLYPALTRFEFSPTRALIGELIPLLAMLAAGTLVARVEHRGILDYNLMGSRRPQHFLSGVVAGFLALSALVAALCWGGWLHFGSVDLYGTAIFQYGLLWALAFAVVGLVEEGIFRCYLLFTLTRGINFWWALGTVGAICLDLALRAKGQEVWGIYLIASLGLVPCLLLHLKRAEASGFWQAAWVTSTLFGFIHTGNNGENWIGIFAASAIGFVFCVSVRVTGSAWWAIGCHAAWDWAETYFYGTADSGIQAKGHYLTANPAGAVLWSGGTDGPEGSLLVIPIIVLLLVAILFIYGRGSIAKEAPSLNARLREDVAG
jgi:membrane protease YdiL (CAAX protease family)